MKAFLLSILCFCFLQSVAQKKPNVIIIIADDLGYGDLSCYGATQIKTPNIDKLAFSGRKFTNAHSTSATCTPSRYALLTGRYPWRKSGTGILQGDASLIISREDETIPEVFQKAGYQTGIVGKWHLGLGNEVKKNWMEVIKPGPNEVGFDYSFIFPATADRVPTIFIENHHLVNPDANDPILVDYQVKIGNEPTGKENPELLKMKNSPNHGHDNTIVNGIGRIGYMSGGKMSRWVDEELSLTFLEKSKAFIDQNKSKPFFLYFATTEPHVPRVPATMFKGKSGLGARGDAILQLDWTVGQIMDKLQSAGIADHTIVMITSDNGPVIDDGYLDGSFESNGNHTPSGVFRGGKYSAFEGGTRIPLIINWPAKIKPSVSDALICQVDLLSSFSEMLNGKNAGKNNTDSKALWPVLIGKTGTGRKSLITQGGSMSITADGWKYIKPNQGPAINKLVNIETGNSQIDQLYHISKDPGEQTNLATKYPEKVLELKSMLDAELKAIVQ